MYGKVRRIDIINKSQERQGKETNLFLISGPFSNRKRSYHSALSYFEDVKATLEGGRVWSMQVFRRGMCRRLEEAIAVSVLGRVQCYP